MKEEIKKILKETLISNYDNGNIEDGGIGGADEAIERLNELFIKNMFQAAASGLTCDRPPYPKVTC